MPTNNGMTNATESEDGTVLGPVFGHILGILFAAASRTVPSWRRPECTDTPGGHFGQREQGSGLHRRRLSEGKRFGFVGCAVFVSIGATGNGVYCVRFSCTCSWRLPSPLASRVDKPCGLRVRKPRLLGSITIRQSDEPPPCRVQAKDSTPDLRQLQVKSNVNHGRSTR